MTQSNENNNETTFEFNGDYIKKVLKNLFLKANMAASKSALSHNGDLKA